MMDKNQASKLRRGHPDYALIVCTLVILAIGVIMIYSSSNYYELQYSKNSQNLLNDTVRWVAVGLAVFIAASSIKYTIYKKWNYAPVYAFFIITAIMLVSLFFLPAVRDVHRWIVVGGFQFQPSEFAKLSLVMALAAYSERYVPWSRSFWERVVHFFVLIGVIGLVAMLIYFEPNKSTAFVFVAIGFLLLFVDGVSVVGLIAVGASGVLLAYAQMLATGELRRINTFLGKDTNVQEAGWQIWQSLIAFGLGGVTGVGLGNGTQNKLYIPEVFNDFILANVGEELGFVGVVLLLLLYVVVIYRCFKIAMNAPDRFSALISAGVAIMLAVHVVLNYMVTTEIVPTTGVTLPLISYGGTSTVVFLGALGLVVGISKYRKVDIS